MESWLVVNAADMASLADWLRGEEELRGRIRLVRRSPGQGEMGSVVDVLAVSLGAGGALTVLASSLSVWLRQPRRATVIVAVAKPDGTKINITGTNMRTPASIENLLRECLHTGEDR